MPKFRRVAASERAHPRAARIAGGAGATLLLAVGALLVQAPVAAHAATSSSGGWIRFGHFATGNGPVKVTIDGRTIAKDVRFETVTPYQAVPVGHETVTISAGGTGAFSRSEQVTVTAGEAVTVGALREPQGIELRQFRDNLSAAPAGMAKVRLVDTASTEQMISIRLSPTGAQTTAIVLPAKSSTDAIATSIANVGYGSASPYVDVRAGTYGVAIDNQAGKAIVTGHGWPVEAGTVASLVVLQTSTGPTLEVLRDAAGTADAPKGGLETGYGGAATSPGSSLTSDPGRLVLDAGLVLVGLLVVGGSLVLVTRSRRGRTGVAAAAAVTAAVLVAAGCGSATHTAAPAPARAVTHPVVATPRAAAPSTTKTNTRATNIDLAGSSTGAPATAASAPTEIAIPSIGVRTSIIRLGRNADGTAEVPATTSVVGWYTDGPEPGQAGPAVILGHVDSYKGPGVFFDLKDVKVGATVQVTEHTRIVTFEVQSVSIYSKDSFPTSAVYGPVPDRALRLVTCGGPFDSATGHYLDNVVAYATEVSSHALA